MSEIKNPMNKLKDDLEAFHGTGLYLPTRTLLITGEVNDDLYASTIKNLHALDSTSGTINIKLNSEGGDVIAGRAIYDAIKNCKNHVRITVYGQASSAASFILQSADERIMTESSYLMLHVGEEGHAQNHPKNVRRWDEFYRKLETWMENIYLQKIKQKKKRYTRNQLKSVLLFDTILNPKEALEMGLIDIIGEVQ